MRGAQVFSGWAARGAVAGIAIALLLLGVGVGGTLAEGPAPQPVRQVRSVTVSTKAVALTFDDGPSMAYTPAVLDALAKYGAKATFFVIGQEVVRYPDIVKSEAAAGMEIANHGFHHLTLRGLDPTAIEAEVRPVEQAITAVTGTRPTLYRLPRGLGDARALRTLADNGYTIVYWSIDTRDYQSRSPAKIAAQVLRQVKPGSIIIFHDGGGNKQHTVEALGMILPQLQKEGYKMVTVSQLLELAQASG